ncbi:MAG: hypothetical protein AB1586_17980 [Pseudomonadota bacterium]
MADIDMVAIETLLRQVRLQKRKIMVRRRRMLRSGIAVIETSHPKSSLLLVAMAVHDILPSVV